MESCWGQREVGSIQSSPWRNRVTRGLNIIKLPKTMFRELAEMMELKILGQGSNSPKNTFRK
jgi:hypothetical protein